MRPWPSVAFSLYFSWVVGFELSIFSPLLSHLSLPRYLTSSFPTKSHFCSWYDKPHSPHFSGFSRGGRRAADSVHWMCSRPRQTPSLSKLCHDLHRRLCPPLASSKPLPQWPVSSIKGEYRDAGLMVACTMEGESIGANGAGNIHPSANTAQENCPRAHKPRGDPRAVWAWLR